MTSLSFLLLACVEPEPAPVDPVPGEGAATWNPALSVEQAPPEIQRPSASAEPRAPSPLGQELLLDAGFEYVYGPTWAVTTGTCDKADGTDTYAPRTGLLSWWGGRDHCETAQTLDLLARGLSADELDQGELGFTLSGWLKNGSPPGDFESRDFDDQVVLRLEALDDDGTLLRAWETLGAGDDVWIQRGVQGLLPAGTRTLTVAVDGTWRRGEIHDSLADDLSLVLTRESSTTASLTKGPMATEARTDGTVVLWETDHPFTTVSLSWWTDAGSTWTPVETTQVDDDRFVHRASIAGVDPDTAVTYQTEQGGQLGEAFTFRTLPQPGDTVRLAFFADNQLGPGQLTTHLDLMGPEDPDVIVAVGDIVQEGWRLADWDLLWFEPLDDSGLTRTRPIIVVRGNHDGEYPETYAYTQVPGDNGAWFAQTVGDLFLVVLDSEAPTDGEQLTFLEEALTSDEAQDASFIAVTFHRTAWSNTRDLAWGHHLDDARTDWEPVFEAHGVDLVITGHHHSYQRGTQRGVTYLVVGGAGNFLDAGHWDQFDFIEIEEIVHHHGMLDVSPTALSWTAVHENGSVLDAFTLMAE